jgi:hypothetical protein
MVPRSINRESMKSQNEIFSERSAFFFVGSSHGDAEVTQVDFATGLASMYHTKERMVATSNQSALA